MKQATVTQANFVKSFDGKYGTMYVHAIGFDNGDQGEYLSKTQAQDKFVVGQQAQYTIQSAGEYQGIPQFKVKPFIDQPQNFTGGGKKGNNVSFAASYAKDIAVAQIEGGQAVSGDTWQKWADFMLNWMNNNS